MKSILAPVAGVLLILSSLGSVAQTYPAKPITLIVPFSPGGRTDLTERAAAIAGGHIDLDFDIVAPMKPFFQKLGLMVNPG